MLNPHCLLCLVYDDFLLIMDHHYHENIDDDDGALWTCIWSTREATRAQAPGSRTKEKIRYGKYLVKGKWFYDVWQGTSQSKQSIWEDKGVERIADLTVSYLDIKRLILLQWKWYHPYFNTPTSTFTLFDESSLRSISFTNLSQYLLNFGRRSNDRLY